MAICVALVPSPVRAQFEDRSGFVGAPEIYMPGEIESARAAGMGRVTSVLSDGAVATWWNPGFLAFQQTRSLSLSSADLSFWRESEPGYIRSATSSGPLPFGPRGLAAGLGFKRLHFEFQNFTPFGEEDLFQSTEDAYVFALACPLFSSLAIGASAEYVRHDLDDETSDAASLGLGVAFHRPIVFMRRDRDRQEPVGGAGRLIITPLAGASFLHVGQDLDFGGSSSELARQLRGGIGFGVALEPPPDTRAFDRRRLSQLDLTTALEVYFPAVEREQISQQRAIVHMGAELVLFGMLSSRIGFIDIDRRQGIGPPFGRRDETFGFGLALPPDLPITVRVDWASVPSLFEERIDRWSVELGLPHAGSTLNP